MRIYFSNQGNLRYFGHFVRKLDFSNTEHLEIITDERWVNVHPAYLVLAAALAKRVGKTNAKITFKVPESGRYLDRMGLYNLISTSSPFGIYKHKDPSGRFIDYSGFSQTAGFEFRQEQNGERATVYGFEFNFIPCFFTTSSSKISIRNS